MSFDRKISLRRLPVLATALSAILLVSGCQVRPLYDQQGVTARNLGAISFSEASNRVGQVVRNNLIFLTSGGAGESEAAEFDVTLNAYSSVANVLLINSSDTARAGQVTVSGTYKLVRKSDSQVLKSGSRSATALVDYSIQEYTKIRAIRDAENVAARELAELIRADLAIALSR